MDISAEKFGSNIITRSIVLPDIIRLHSSVRCVVSTIIPLQLVKELLNLPWEPRFCGILWFSIKVIARNGIESSCSSNKDVREPALHRARI